MIKVGGGGSNRKDDEQEKKGGKQKGQRKHGKRAHLVSWSRSWSDVPSTPPHPTLLSREHHGTSIPSTSQLHCRHDWNEAGARERGYVTEDKGAQPGPGLWDLGSCQKSLNHKAAGYRVCGVFLGEGMGEPGCCIGWCCLVLEIA